jgi:hypothetical protein
MTKTDSKTSSGTLQQSDSTPFWHYNKKAEDEKAGGLPILKYGKGNNLHKFKLALAELAIREYGNLGKLIELEKYYIPKLILPTMQQWE